MKPTKTVRHAVEWANNEWSGGSCNAIAYNELEDRFGYYRAPIELFENWHHVCTIEQFEVCMKMVELGIDYEKLTVNEHRLLSVVCAQKQEIDTLNYKLAVQNKRIEAFENAALGADYVTKTFENKELE